MRILMLFGLVLSLAACNTVQGIGKDIKEAGKSIEKAGSK